MIKAFPRVILLFFLIPSCLSLAQEASGGSKVYSGYLHQYVVKTQPSFWHSLFGAPAHKQEEILQDRQCSVEFKSAVAFSHESVSVVPGKLSYFIRFTNSGLASKSEPIKGADAFDKFVIKIYTNDDQEYLIDPQSEGKQVAIDGEHRIFDQYLIYLILGTSIDHLEIISSIGGDKPDKYVLDKLEVHDNH